MTVRRGSIQQLSCHAQSQSVPVPSGGKVIEDLSFRVFSLKSPGIRATARLLPQKIHQTRPAAGAVVHFAVDDLSVGQIIHVPAHGYDRQSDVRGDFIARVPLVRRGAQIGLDPRKSLALQTLRGSSRRRRRRLPEQRVIERILTEAVALHAFPAAAEHLERLLKPLIGKGLDQIIHGAQPHRVIDCFGIVCRRYHDHICVHALCAELHQQLGAAHLRHVNVQNDQVDRIALKPEQSRMRRRRHLRSP